MKQLPQSLYERVVSVTEEYLGPASRRFIDRQIYHHLNKDPVELARSDLESLVRWIRLTAAYLTDDSQLIDEFCNRLLRLRRNNGKP